MRSSEPLLAKTSSSSPNPWKNLWGIRAISSQSFLWSSQMPIPLIISGLSYFAKKFGRRLPECLTSSSRGLENWMMSLQAVVRMTSSTFRVSDPPLCSYLTWNRSSGSGQQSARWQKDFLFSFSLAFALNPGLKLLPDCFCFMAWMMKTEIYKLILFCEESFYGIG